MSTIRLQRMPIAPARIALVLRLLSVVLALLTTAILLWATGRDPIALGAKVLSSTFGSSFGLEDLALLFSPLIYCGLAVAVALRIGAWNIGAEGQFNFGAFCATGIALFVPGPTWLMLPLMALAGMIGGALWILVPTLARAYADVSELITTLLMNFIAMLLVYWVATGPWLDPSGMALATTARLPVSVPPIWGIVHWGLPVAVMLAIALALVFTYTRWGYEVRIAGANPGAAAYAGMPVKRQLIAVMLLSGALAGLGGMMEAAGTVGRLQGGISNNYGYIGIMVAVLARAAPLGVLATAFFMAVILNGGIVLQSQGLTTHTVLAVTGLILLYAAIGDEAAHYKILRNKTGES
ncbi:ABC transporter permease [Celeribacter neptunius]|uniref:Simple sugar transport system permease protein n=1 Tax=Celeribacter neptunius TaxID=588602 RepID=A0A1I3NNC7_9RHOB|nr:ABC transporter permease [Celeribacter neptunius]SFJ10781.1 simple sugar transport system permease protein [Celeribacter neptunius]